MNQVIKDLEDIMRGNPWDTRHKLESYILQLEKDSKEAINDKSKRTSSQNSSIHLYLDKISEQLQNEGHTMQDVVTAIKRAEIIPTMLALKEVVWKPIQKIMYGVDSTTKLRKTGQIENVYMVVDKFFAENFGATHPFPSKTVVTKENDYLNNANSLRNSIEYPNEQH